jgi:dihydrofolate synthase / folylpolyglutamate synthase
MQYNQVIQYLESLTIMPKTMPGLEKIRSAVTSKDWFPKLDPKKIITIAGTNGKGTTAAALEALLLSTGKKVGLYTSPHLVNTTERIRVNGLDISETAFAQLFLDNKATIEKDELSHFESLTLMAADYFFTQDLDFVILEVGLGGIYDATNIFPNHYAVITKIGFDHENILGNNLIDIAKNKFGIIKQGAVVVHHHLDTQFKNLIEETQHKTNSTWISGSEMSRVFETNLIGPRAQENIATAVKVFATLGFNFEPHKSALKKINWPGRMQLISWPGMSCSVYLSGDHNPQGIESLIEILESYQYEYLHLIVGIGVDKSGDEMLQQILSIPRVKLYLTETPFKGRKFEDYPEFAKQVAIMSDRDGISLLNKIKPQPKDMVVVTGSLYLVGKVLNEITHPQR